ncbi:MAG: leucine-rich repeat domain-containing protein [Gammaproteobacteria bacterium]|nr:leucine-rich repeat domain-containing protein [Gammaproteobacteria bacterium]
MPRLAIRRIASPALFACAVLAVAANAAAAQSPPAGVFSEVQTVVAPQVSPALEPATMRSRVVQLNTQKITAARRGREILTLNLFDDAVVEVDIRRIRPTRAGYFFYGRPKGVDRGEVQLVVNGRVMVGTVRTAEGTFTIRPARSGRHVIRQIDPSRDPFECEVEDGPLHDPSDLPAVSSIGPAPSPATTPSVASNVPTEDGSEIRVLIAYTTAVEQAHGGAAGMNALIDLMMQSANQAFENSGIAPRLVLAHAVRVHYGETGSYAPTQDLHRLRTPDDGYMDEVHALRNEHAADLVHLVGTGAASGRAYALRNESLSSERNAFGITWAPAGSPAEYVFTHEVGHNLGLLHDRYVEKAKRALYPYAYGYVNKEAFEAGAAENSRWRTVMSYPHRCRDADFSEGCEWLLRFSNPDQTYLGDALGSAGEEHVVDPDGPSDARRTINGTAALAGSFRSEACTDFTAAPTNHVISADGGRLVVEVNTAYGCLWETANAPDHVEVVSQTPMAGSGSIVIAVAANQSGQDRVGTITVAGNAITVNQLGTTEGVCGRTSGVFQAITNAAGFTDAARCSELTESSLARIVTLDLRDKGLVSLKPGDLAGLSGLQTLYLNRNEITELPEQIFDGLTSLQSLNLSDNELTSVPEGIFEGLSGLQSLLLAGNPLGEVPVGLFAGVPGLQTLNLDNNRFVSLPDGLFDGLSNLQELRLARNRLSALPATLLGDLSGLRSLYLSGNRLRELPVGTFSGLSALESLTLSYNEIDSLPVGLFDGLSNLKQLFLHSNRLTRLPIGYFEKLGSLQSLSLGQNQFGNLPGDLFRGLSSLQVLSLEFNSLTQLPTGLFSGLSSLENLRLNNNRFSDLPIELFDGLSSLRLLDLRSNRFTRLPDHLFSSLPALPQLFLSGNTYDPLPLQVTLEEVGEDQFKAVAPTGAPFELVVPVSTRGGMIEGAVSSVTIAATDEESSPLRVTRQEGSLDAVTADIGTLPGLPRGHLGYVLEKGGSLPLEILKPQGSRDVALAGLSLGRWTLDPAFAQDTLKYAAIVGNDVSSITVTATVRSADAAVQLLDVNDNALADADAAAEGHQASLSPGPNTIKATVTAGDGTTTRTYTLVVTRDGPGGVCARTPQIRDGIVRAVRNVDACAEVTGEHLKTITSLSTRNRGIESLRTDDFAGLSAVRSLFLDGNRLTTLPADVFAGTPALEDLWLQGNRIEALPAGIFAGLPAIETILLDNNRLNSLPQGIFSGLTTL